MAALSVPISGGGVDGGAHEEPITAAATGIADRATVNQAYFAVDVADTGNTAPLAIVHVFNDKGELLDLSTAMVSNLTYNTSGGQIHIGNAGSGTRNTLYAADDCGGSGFFKDYPNDPGELGTLDAQGNPDGSEIPTNACVVTMSLDAGPLANSGLWVEWDAPGVAGEYTATFTVRMGDVLFPLSVDYVVSSTLAGSWSLELNQSSYAPGALAQATIAVGDLSGRIVPDGLGWASVSPSGRDIDVVTTAPIYNPRTGASIPPGAIFRPADAVSTYNGSSVYGTFFAPPRPMSTFELVVESVTSDGWAQATTGQVQVATATIADPDPQSASIRIVGERSASRTVSVEGFTEGLSGAEVTPYIRFPGQVGLNPGSGTRRVNLDGTFAWQRKTGKRIAVQFRFGDVRSNTVVIPAR